MTQESKRTAIATLHTAAGRAVKPSRYRRQRNYSGCCAAMAGTTPWEVYLAFESTFKPAHDPAYWWLALWVWPTAALTDAFCDMFVGVHIFPPGAGNAAYIARTTIGLALLFVLLLCMVDEQHLKERR